MVTSPQFKSTAVSHSLIGNCRHVSATVHSSCAQPACVVLRRTAVCPRRRRQLERRDRLRHGGGALHPGRSAAAGRPADDGQPPRLRPGRQPIPRAGKLGSGSRALRHGGGPADGAEPRTVQPLLGLFRRQPHPEQPRQRQPAGSSGGAARPQRARPRPGAGLSQRPVLGGRADPGARLPRPGRLCRHRRGGRPLARHQRLPDQPNPRPAGDASSGGGDMRDVGRTGGAAPGDPGRLDRLRHGRRGRGPLLRSAQRRGAGGGLRRGARRRAGPVGRARLHARGRRAVLGRQRRPAGRAGDHRRHGPRLAVGHRPWPGDRLHRFGESRLSGPADCVPGCQQPPGCGRAAARGDRHRGRGEPHRHCGGRGRDRERCGSDADRQPPRPLRSRRGCRTSDGRPAGSAGLLVHLRAAAGPAQLRRDGKRDRQRP